MWRALVLVVITVAACVAAWTSHIARAQPQIVDRCAAGSADARTAERAVRSFETLLARAVDPDLRASDPTQLGALRSLAAELREMPCLRAAAEAREAWPSFRSVWAVRAWWDAGGGDWLLHLARGRRAGDAAYDVVFPPHPPDVVDLEGLAADAPERAWVCAATDAACAAETVGWRARAEAAFVAHAARLREEAAARDGGADARSRIDACAARARSAATEEHRYITWLDCVSATRERSVSLPIGRIRGPSRGWLVVAGRRGHHGYEHGVAAYDLEHGAAFAASVSDGRRARAEGEPTVERRTVAGRVAPHNVRELLWMLLWLRDVGPPSPRRATTVRLPPGLTTRWRTDAPRSFHFADDVVSSDQTELAWTWQDGARTLASGTLTWPRSSHAAQDHAASLLRIVELGLVPGCVPRPLAASLASAPAAPSDVADRASLIASLRRLRPPRCRAR